MQYCDTGHVSAPQLRKYVMQIVRNFAAVPIVGLVFAILPASFNAAPSVYPPWRSDLHPPWRSDLHKSLNIIEKIVKLGLNQALIRLFVSQNAPISVGRRNQNLDFDPNMAGLRPGFG